MRGDDPDAADMLGISESVCPACAGMIRPNSHDHHSWGSLPRMRGDDPDYADGITPTKQFAPHARG